MYNFESIELDPTNFLTEIYLTYNARIDLFDVDAFFFYKLVVETRTE